MFWKQVPSPDGSGILWRRGSPAQIQRTAGVAPRKANGISNLVK